MLEPCNWTPEDAAEAIANYVNGHSHLDFNKVAKALTQREHRTLQQQALGLFLACIAAWADLGPNEYDERNAWTVERSKEIVIAVGEYSLRPPLI